MEFIFEIYCENFEGDEWVDSHWLDEEKAREEFENVVYIAEERLPPTMKIFDEEDEEKEEDFPLPLLKTIRLFKRCLNCSGNASHYWRDKEKILMSATINARHTEYNVREGW